MKQNQKPQTLEEKWQNATIANNFIFYKVMRNNPDICKELLEILLEFKIQRIEMSQEEEINIDFDSKGIRMDVYAKDTNGQKVYNIELQSTNTKELPERARYYQGVIDIDLLKSGQKYKDLKTSFVIFICVDDIFGHGLPKYTFENICTEAPKIKLNDRTFKYFFISKNCDKIFDERQKAFLRMLTENKASDEFTGKVMKLVDEAKRNAQWRKQYMEWEREKTYIREDAIEEGRSQGKEEKAVEAAVTLVQKYNATPETAANDMGAPLDLLLEALKENAPTAS